MPIPISIGSDKEFQPASEGVHQAVIADIVDLGEMDTQFGPKEKVRIVWLTDEVDQDGKTIRVQETFTKSLHEKATLTKRVKSILGSVPTGNSFDLESLIGTNAQIVVEHNEGTNGRTYANVTAVMKPKPGMPKLNIPSDFKRREAKN